MIEVENGSIGLNVVGLMSSSGSGRFSQWRMWPWKMYVTTNATTIAIRQMTIRALQLAEVLDERRLLAVAKAPREEPHCVYERLGGCSSADGRRESRGCSSSLPVIESLNSRMPLPSERPDLREPLRAEDEEDDEQNDDQTRNTDLRHGSSVARFRLSGAARSGLARLI